VTSATAIVGRGTVHNPNVGAPCTSGRLLHIKLIGALPHITTTGGPGGPVGLVSAVLLTGLQQARPVQPGRSRGGSEFLTLCQDRDQGGQRGPREVARWS